MGLSIRTDLAGVTSFVRGLGLAARNLQTLTAPLPQLRARAATASPSSGRAGVAMPSRPFRRFLPRLSRRRPQGPQGRSQDARRQKAPPGIREQLQAPVHLRPQLPVHLPADPHGQRATPRPCRWSRASAKAWSGPTATDARSSTGSSCSFSRWLAALEAPVILVADAYYASRKVILPLLAAGHHLVTRARSNAVAYEPAPRPKRRRRGRPRLYGNRVRLRDLLRRRRRLRVRSQSRLRRDRRHDRVSLRRLCSGDPLAGSCASSSSATPPAAPSSSCPPTSPWTRSTSSSSTATASRSSSASARRCTSSARYAYHFWMMAMTPIRRVSGNQYMHHKSEALSPTGAPQAGRLPQPRPARLHRSGPAAVPRDHLRLHRLAALPQLATHDAHRSARPPSSSSRTPCARASPNFSPLAPQTPPSRNSCAAGFFQPPDQAHQRRAA